MVPDVLAESVPVTDFLVKVRHYRGGESVIERFGSRQEAQDVARGLNERYHTDHYYVEPFDPAKAGGYTQVLPNTKDL